MTSSHCKNVIKILFLGASKRVSLIERFLSSAKDLGVNLELFSCEKDSGFYPISIHAKVLSGPKFLSLEFQSWLEKTIRKNGIDIVIPNMDSATVALSLFKKEHPSCAALLLVSDHSLAESMNNKQLANKFFLSNFIPVPSNYPNHYPKIIKPVEGFGSKGIIIINNEKEFLDFNNEESKFLVQDLILGEETTVDFYISAKKGLSGYVLRDRIEVSDGEVMVCKTRDPNDKEIQLIERIAKITGWLGCITLQYIRDKEGNLYVIEINPRFGGGVTCSIEAGLNMPLYILLEFMGLDFNVDEEFKHLIMSRARRDFFHEIKK